MTQSTRSAWPIKSSLRAPGSIAAEGYTDVLSATLDGPQVNTNPGSSSALNGNDPTNRVADITSIVSSINWAPGDEIWIRFQDVNDSGFDHGLGVDNFRFTAIPEPPAYAALFGLAVWGASILKNRRKKDWFNSPSQ